MDNPEISTKGLMKYIKGPDFPTGAAITNTDDLFDIYDTGEGKIKLRAKAEIENGTNGRKNIVDNRDTVHRRRKQDKTS